MSAPLFAPCLLLAVGVAAALAATPVKYKRVSGTFTNTPDATGSAASRVTCSAKCTAMELWFCGGFTYHDSGICDLYRDVSSETEEAAPPSEVDISSEPRSYRRLAHSTCPGTASSPCDCPAGFSRCAGRCLAKLDQQAAYSDAATLCAELGAHLLVPRSEAENQCAFQLRADQWSWLGVTDIADEGVYEGADGRGAFPGTGGWWKDGDPDNWLGAEHCVGMISTDRWNDRPCGDTNYPLCQLQGCLKPLCP